MKRNQFLILFYSLFGLLFWCCSSENVVDEPSSGEPSTVSLYAGYGDDDDSSTRTTLDEFANVKWSATDVINVNGQKSTQTTLLNDGAKAVFTVTAAATTYYALYPAYSDAVYGGGMFSFNFPSEQPYKDNVSFSDGVNPSMAVSTTRYLSFYNVCGIVKAQIKANIAGVRKIRFLSVDNVVAGQTQLFESPKRLQISGSTKSMDVTFASDQTLTSSSPLTIRWVLPAGSYTAGTYSPTATYGAGWKIELLDSENKLLMKKTFQNSLAVTCSKITNVGTLTYTSDDAPKILDGVLLNELFWARGNLIYSNGIYSFASTQEYCSGVWNGGDYFCWNTLDPIVTSSTNATDSYDASTDPCTKVAPAGTWRTPTYNESWDLVNRGGSVWATKNGKNGRYFGTTTTPASGAENNYLFLPAAGFRLGNWLYSDGNYGHYWSPTTVRDDDASGFTFSIFSATAYGGGQNLGYSIRCVSPQ